MSGFVFLVAWLTSLLLEAGEYVLLYGSMGSAVLCIWLSVELLVDG